MSVLQKSATFANAFTTNLIYRQMKSKIYTILAATMLSASAYAAAPEGYYDSCEGKTGKALLKALESVISSHTNVGYDGLWDVYKDSDVHDDGSVWDMYSTKDWGRNWEQYKNKNYKAVGDALNREHSFPKSWFGNASPMNSDAFHIYPTDGYVNNQRSNFPYGVCANGETKTNGSVRGLGRLGASTYPGYSGKVFEPDDEYKGDFARTYFYMAACYNSRIKGWSADCLAGNDYPCYKTWAVEMFMEWAHNDRVSKKETDRNDAVYRHQRNRNPFIDHPELADYIWGDKNGTPWYPDGSVTPGPGGEDPDPGPGEDPDPTPGPGGDDEPGETPDFLETFENPGQSSYSTKEYVGSAATWSTDAYFVANNDQSFPYEGLQAARTNKTGTGFLEMTTDKANGAGVVSFYAKRWQTTGNPDDEAAFDLMVSTDKGNTWHTVTSIPVTATTYERHAVEVNVPYPAEVRIRLKQTAGKRVMIDNLGITDYVVDAIDETGADYTYPGAETTYYNLQGIRVTTPHEGEVYIRRVGNIVGKIRY